MTWKEFDNGSKERLVILAILLVLSVLFVHSMIWGMSLLTLFEIVHTYELACKNVIINREKALILDLKRECDNAIFKMDLFEGERNRLLEENEVLNAVMSDYEKVISASTYGD